MKLFCEGISWILEVALVLTQVEIIWSQARYYATKTATKCFAVSRESELQFAPCKPGHMILIEEAFQGMSQSLGSCEYQWGDCITTVSAKTEASLYRCIGTRECDVTVRQEWLPQCFAYTDYISVLYKCVAAEDVTDICETQIRSMYRRGYIKSHNYPVEYGANVVCQCNITTNYDQKILLTFSDFAVEWSENCFSDVLEIRDGYYEYARCGRIPRNHNLTSSTNQMEITFKTDSTQQHKGFWLQVEALGDMKVSCASKSLPQTFPTTGVITTTEFTTSPDPITTTHSPTTAPYRWPNTPIRTSDASQPTRNAPVFGSTNYKITMGEIHTHDGKILGESSDLDPGHSKSTSGWKQRTVDGDESFDSIDKQFDLLLTQDLLSKYVTNWNTAQFDGQLGAYDNSEGDTTTGGTVNERVKPELVLSPTAGIVIGCIVLVITVLVIICVCIWRRRHRKKKAITKADRNEPKLTRHSYPPVNPSRRPSQPIDQSYPCSSSGSTAGLSHQYGYHGSPENGRSSLPSTHFINENVMARQYMAPPGGEDSRSETSVHYRDRRADVAHGNLTLFPESPVDSYKSYGSDYSAESGRSGLRRGERVKKNYKRTRTSPRLDAAHYESSNEELR